MGMAKYDPTHIRPVHAIRSAACTNQPLPDRGPPPVPPPMASSSVCSTSQAGASDLLLTIGGGDLGVLGSDRLMTLLHPFLLTVALLAFF
ncbi:hypothetical protein COCNU_01G017190 [Cocos nucifera]|uniref:Uncharacterized protein n=1 Tax=Cocos nucifera TaxID=13894 RepID=A0A8K0HX19_COCNU|nr:hypothetical protein COCNU_01G017190 [Cocos nucifera]